MISPVKPEVTASTNATTGTEAAFQAVVDSIVKRFDELGIAYCLLRNRDEIPAGLYTAVAEVLAWVYQLKRWQAEGGEAPRTPGELPIPQDLEYNLQAA